MKGCGKKFYVRRDPNGYITQTFGKNGINEINNSSPKVLLVCGNNLSRTLCQECVMLGVSAQ